MHYTVNHKNNFVNSTNGAHTQGIESYWVKTKYMIKKMKGLNRKYLTSYLC